MVHAWSDKELPIHHNWPSHTPCNEIVVVFMIRFKGIDKNELNKPSGGFQFTRTRFTTHLAHVGCVQSKRLAHTRTNFTTKRRWREEITNFDNTKSTLKIEKNTYANVRNIHHGHALPNLFQGDADQVACTDNLPLYIATFWLMATRPLVLSGTLWYTNN